MKFKFIFAFMCILNLIAQNSMALEVDRKVMPRITLGGKAVVTADSYSYDKFSTNNKEDIIETDDSALLLRFDKHMYGVESGVGGAVIGFREVGNSIVFHQLNAFYWNKNFGFLIGKTKLRNNIIELPTFRDEDLIDYSHVNTASSDEEYDQLYGSNIELDWYIGQANQTIGAWAGTRNNDTGNPNAPVGYDTKGIRYNYEINEDIKYINRIRHAGILVDTQRVQTASGLEWMSSTIAGIEINLNINPTSSWSMGIQAISNEGITGATDLTSISTRAQAKSNSQVISLRYVSRPHLLTRWQAGLVLATKKYENVTNAKNSSVIANFSYILGQGLNLITQMKYTDNSNDINNGNDETVVQVGISFEFDTVFNNTIGKRNSILNLEHGYIQ